MLSIPMKRALLIGLIAGGAGYLASIIFFVIANLVSGHPALYTPAVMGSVLFYGVRDLGTMTIWAGPVLAFNGAYLLAFVLCGVLLSALAEQTHHGAPLFFVTGVVVVLTLLHVAVGSLVGSRMNGLAIPLQLVMLGALVASLAMMLVVYRLPGNNV